MVAEEEKFPFQGSLCNSNKKVLSMIVIVQGENKVLRWNIKKLLSLDATTRVWKSLNKKFTIFTKDFNLSLQVKSIFQFSWKFLLLPPTRASAKIYFIFHLSLSHQKVFFILSNMTMKFSAMGNKKFILSPFIASTDVVLFFLYMPSEEKLKGSKGCWAFFK